MPRSPKKPTKYTGRYIYNKIDAVTGEVTEVGEFDEFQTCLPIDENKPRRGNNFAILYLLEFYSMLDSLGGKKMSVMRYIVEHMDYNNLLLETEEQIAKGANVSLRTVKRTVKIMKEAGFIAQRPGRIMLNPQLLNRKNISGERNIMVKFRALKQE